MEFKRMKPPWKFKWNEFSDYLSTDERAKVAFYANAQLAKWFKGVQFLTKMKPCEHEKADITICYGILKYRCANQDCKVKLRPSTFEEIK